MEKSDILGESGAESSKRIVHPVNCAPVSKSSLGPRPFMPAAPPCTARAGNRRFWMLSALRAHTKAPYKTDLHSP